MASIHPKYVKANIFLSAGIHRIRVTYFQGPRYCLALMMAVARSGQPWRIFDTENFAPPPNPDSWSQDTVPGGKDHKHCDGSSYYQGHFSATRARHVERKAGKDVRLYSMTPIRGSHPDRSIPSIHEQSLPLDQQAPHSKAFIALGQSFPAT
jgi:hypothetical protein